MNGFWGKTKESGYVIGVRNAEAYEREDSEFGGKFTGRGDRELCIGAEELIEVLYEMWEEREKRLIEMEIECTEVFIDEIGGFYGCE